MTFIKNYNKIAFDTRLMDDGAAIAQAGLNALGTSLGGISSYKSAKKIMREQMRWQESMYQRQVDDNRANWQMQNDYNTPLAQRQRLEQAGYNPALFGADLQSGSSADAVQGGAVSSAPSFTNMPNVFADAVSSATATFAAMSNREIGLANAAVNASNSRTSADYYGVLSGQVNANIGLLKQENAFRSEYLQTQISGMRIKNYAQSLQAEAQAITNKTLSDKNIMDLATMANEYDLITEKIKSEKMSRNEAAQRIRSMKQQVKLMVSQGQYYDAQTETENELRPSAVRTSEAHATNVENGRADDFNTKERLAPVSVGFNVSGGPFKGGAHVTLPLKGMAQDGGTFIRNTLKEFSGDDVSDDFYVPAPVGSLALPTR